MTFGSRREKQPKEKERERNCCLSFLFGRCKFQNDDRSENYDAMRKCWLINGETNSLVQYFGCQHIFSLRREHSIGEPFSTVECKTKSRLTFAVAFCFLLLLFLCVVHFSSRLNANKQYFSFCTRVPVAKYQSVERDPFRFVSCIPI